MEANDDDRWRDIYVLYLLSSLIAAFVIVIYNGEFGIVQDYHVGDNK